MDIEKQKIKPRGRKTKEARSKEIKQVLKFIFIFRFIFHREASNFISKVLGLSDPRRLIEMCMKEGYVLKANINDDLRRSTFYQRKYYYLTKKGVEYLDEDLPRSLYSFRKDRHINLRMIPHNSYVIDVYFLLNNKFDDTFWISEWILRNNAKKRVRLPDALFVINNKIKIAIEVEKTYKTPGEWREVISRYKRNMRNASCHGVLIVAFEDVFEGIRNCVHKNDKRFSNQHIFLTSFKGLAKNRLLCYDDVLSVEDMVQQVEDKDNL